MSSLNKDIPIEKKDEHDIIIPLFSRVDRLLRNGKIEEAENLFRGTLQWSSINQGAAHEMPVTSQEELSTILAQLQLKVEGIDDVDIIRTRAALAEDHYRLGHHDNCDPLLVEKARALMIAICHSKKDGIRLGRDGTTYCREKLVTLLEKPLNRKQNVTDLMAELAEKEKTNLANIVKTRQAEEEKGRWPERQRSRLASIVRAHQARIEQDLHAGEKVERKGVWSKIIEEARVGDIDKVIHAKRDRDLQAEKDTGWPETQVSEAIDQVIIPDRLGISDSSTHPTGHAEGALFSTVDFDLTKRLDEEYNQQSSDAESSSRPDLDKEDIYHGEPQIERISITEGDVDDLLDRDVDDEKREGESIAKTQVTVDVQLDEGSGKEQHGQAKVDMHINKRSRPQSRESSHYEYHTAHESPTRETEYIPSINETPHISIREAEEQLDKPKGERPGNALDLDTNTHTLPSISVRQKEETRLNQQQWEHRPKPLEPILQSYQRRVLPPATALFDALEGQRSKGPERWFHDLSIRTHALLAPLQTGAFKRVKIAVLDTGIDMDQINLWDKGRVTFMNGANPRIKKRKDFLDPDGSNKCRDHDGNGTHCIGVLRRVAPEADIYVARVATSRQEGPSVNAVIEAISYAQAHWDVDIISLSFGFEEWVTPLERAIRAALDGSKTLFLAATLSSNYGTSRAMAFPARMPDVISLHAADYSGQAAGASPTVEYGKNLTILGVDVVSAWITPPPPPSSSSDLFAAAASTRKNGQTATTHAMTGTSVATPVAAGVAALVLEFAGQRDLDDPETDRVLQKLGPFLRRQHGMNSVFRAMAVPTGAGEFLNIVPWNLLRAETGSGSGSDSDNETLGRRMAAFALRSVIKNAFGQLIE